MIRKHTESRYVVRMRSNEIFAGMSGEDALRFLEQMREEAPDVATLALGAASEAFRLRPQFLRRQPRARQAEWMRRALGRTVGATLAEEVLATYFLDHKREMLVELLDTLGVAHEEGRLEQDHPPCPDEKSLEKAVAKFRRGDEPERRDLLVRAFAAQSSVDWPDLDTLIAAAPGPRAADPSPPSRREARGPRKRAGARSAAKAKAKVRKAPKARKAQKARKKKR